VIIALWLVERQNRPSLTSLHNTKNRDVKAKCDGESFKKFAAQNVNLDPCSYTSPRRGIHVHILFM